MSFGEKIYKLRKEKGYTQEELAELLYVPIEVISKVEDDLISLDIDKIRLLADVFNVSLSRLIDGAPIPEDKPDTLEHSFIEKYLTIRHRNSFLLGFAVLLFILSSVPLICLAMLAEASYISIIEDMAGILGFIILLVIVAIGVSLCVYTSLSLKEYQEKLQFDFGLSPEDKNFLTHKKKDYNKTYTLFTLIGVLILILSIIPILVSTLKSEEESLELAIGIASTFGLVSIGVFLLVVTNYYTSSFTTLLYEKSLYKSTYERTFELINSCLWMITLIVYLVASFISMRWDITWIIFVISGFISAILGVIQDYIKRNPKV